MYCIFGSCKDITIGPTALMSLMTYQQVVGRNADFAVLLCFTSGVVQLLMGLFHLGKFCPSLRGWAHAAYKARSYTYKYLHTYAYFRLVLRTYAGIPIRHAAVRERERRD